MKETVWKCLSKICTATPAWKAACLKAYAAVRRLEYRILGVGIRVEPHTVIFEAYMAKKYACSPRALYEEMCRDPRYGGWRKIWAFRDPARYAFLAENPDTEVVGYRTAAYYRAYAAAAYWITNSRLPGELFPRKGQSYIQCWHGTPLKKLGFDLKQYAEAGSTLREVRENYWREAVRVTQMPSPSPFYTEKMISAFCLEKAGKSGVLTEMGYPRNDRLFSADAGERQRLAGSLGLPPDREVILYAPTWREDQHVPGEAYRFRLAMDFDRLREKLGGRYVVLFRAHYLIAQQYDFTKWKGFVWDVSDWDEVNDLYLLADVLVTDYSSVFFDYANLNRPMLFYMYDYEKYRYRMRDFYLEEEELPGPVVRTQEELADMLLSIGTVRAAYGKKIRQFNRRFNPHRGSCSGEYLQLWLRDHRGQNAGESEKGKK